jgi:hypothetical protein
MTRQILLYLLIFIGLPSCYNGNAEEERIKIIIEKIKKEYKGEYRHIYLDSTEVNYISGRPFYEIREGSTRNIFCNKCNDAESILIPTSFYLDLETLNITFKGNCLKCHDTLISGYAMHKRIDFLQKTLEKRKSGL